MAVFCLASSLHDLKERLARIVCAYTYDGQPVTAGQIGAAGAMAALLKDAIDPNLVQTLEHNPAIIHGGPFANIAHGCNSVMATRSAWPWPTMWSPRRASAPTWGPKSSWTSSAGPPASPPAACVLVATVRALKSHAGWPRPT